MVKRVDAKEFGRYLKSLRDEKKLTLTELGKRIDYSNPYLSQIETGKKGIPSPKLLKLLSKELGVDFEELMFAAGYITGEDEKKIAHVIKNTHDQDLKDFIQGGSLRKYFYDGKRIERDSSEFLTEVLEIILEDALYIAEDADLEEIIIDKEKQGDIKTILKIILKNNHHHNLS